MLIFESGAWQNIEEHANQSQERPLTRQGEALLSTQQTAKSLYSQADRGRLSQPASASHGASLSKPF